MHSSRKISKRYWSLGSGHFLDSSKLWDLGISCSVPVILSASVESLKDAGGDDCSHNGEMLPNISVALVVAVRRANTV